MDQSTATPSHETSEPGMTGRSIVVDASVPPGEKPIAPPVDEVSKSLQDMKIQTGVAAKKKKKKKSRSKASKGVSGFEDNYADAPVTPAEHSEESKIYDPSRSFAERIEICIQRYRLRRKFDSMRKNVFDKYLTLGGIDTGQKMFGGGIDRSADDEDGEYEGDPNAIDFVSSDKASAGTKGSEWVVDFEGVAKCFFSSYYFINLDFATEIEIHRCTAVIRNFLNYVLHHNACPEYTEQILATRRLCDLANEEIIKVRRVSTALPGDFNMACSTLHGGFFKGLYCEGFEWAYEDGSAMGMSDKKAKDTFMTGLSAYGTDDQVIAALTGLHTVGTKPMSFEITGIEGPDDQIRDFYERQLKGSYKALGKMKAKRWWNPWAADEDVTDEEAEAERAKDTIEYEFWVNMDVLDDCFVGMKMDAQVYELSCGLRYFDTVTNVYCSYHTSMEVEMMSGWKQPGPRGGGELQQEEANNEEGEKVLGDEDAEW
ncbi:MAG: hypothetical protein M1817_005361 [Caeruleum heppii]|nr:MAG: hypothetical protein M1817_005361 [Caeruleum heppii]